MTAWFPDLDTVVTAAPGTGSTSLMSARLDAPGAIDPVATLVRVDHDHVDGPVDPKHATWSRIREHLPTTPSDSRAADGTDPDTVRHVVTATRDPWDFYLAEWTRLRTRWALELDQPDSWVHRVAGVRDSIRAATTLDFDDWILHEFAADMETGDSERRLNRGHVDEATVVVRMEHLDHDLARLHPDLARRIGPIPHLNRTDRRRDLAAAYSQRSARIVADAHAADIARFGYAFPTP